jgi:hypothetical protein
MSIFKNIKLGELIESVADAATAVVPGGKLVEGVVKEVIDVKGVVKEVIDAVDGKDDGPGKKKHAGEGNRRQNRRHRPK